MESFLVHMCARNDERLLQRTLLGRLLFIFAATSFDANWGIAPFSLTAIVARAFPFEQSAADHGDQEGIAFIAEARREMLAMIDTGLFLIGDCRDDQCIAYRSWERYHTKLNRRGAPSIDTPCSAEIALTRDWSKTTKNSIPRLLIWAEKHDILPEVFTDGKPRKTVSPWSDQVQPMVRPDSDQIQPVVSTGYLGTWEVGSRKGGSGEGPDEVPPPPLQSEEPKTDEPNDFSETLPERAENVLAECGVRPSQVDDLTKDFTEGDLQCADGDRLAYVLAVCLETMRRGDGKHKTNTRSILRDRDTLSRSDVREAQAILKGERPMKRSNILPGCAECRRPFRVHESWSKEPRENWPKLCGDCSKPKADEAEEGTE